MLLLPRADMWMRAQTIVVAVCERRVSEALCEFFYNSTAKCAVRDNHVELCVVEIAFSQFFENCAQ